MTPTARRSQQECVRVSLRWFNFWWVIILGVHCAACGYNAVYALFYWNFGDTFLSYTLEFSRISIPRQYFLTVSCATDDHRFTYALDLAILTMELEAVLS
ncbi:hypothetical protein GN244_ATG09048 [Phytophthora infestans]|uniref:Uncharacterized protein n=1 Tax=Phytophthora infestans TaxID=4787 RepID=A0A833SVN5_PHYIN|nr:hypothetical protein GN244_ATG09048 [Phytophthora infestans]